MTADVDPEARRRSWALVAEAAAIHRRLIGGEDVSYGDPDLKRTSQSVARGSLLRAVERALAAGVEHEEIADAIRSGDPSFGVAEADDYIEAVPQLRAGLRELNARVLRELFGERD